MLGFLKGMNTNVNRETGMRDRAHVRTLTTQKTYLDDVVGQHQWKANYDLKKSDLESILESRSLNRDATRQSMRHQEEYQPHRVEGMRLGNESTRQSIRHQEGYYPHRVEAMKAGNESTRQSIRHQEGYYPHRVEAMKAGNESTRQSIRHQEEYHPHRVEAMKSGNESTRVSTDLNRQTHGQREKTFGAQEPHLDAMARLRKEQAEANVGLTKAQTDHYGRRQGSSDSVLRKPTRQDVVDMFKKGNVGGTMTDQGGSWPPFANWWGNKVLPYDAPEGKASQKGYLRTGGQQAARRVRAQVPMGALTYNDIHGYADAAWQAILESDTAEEFMKDITKGVDPNQRLTRIEDARRQFIQSFVNEMLNPAAAKTLDSPGMGGETDIDHGLLDRPVGTPGVDAPAVRPDAQHVGTVSDTPQTGAGEGPPALRPLGIGNITKPDTESSLQAPAIRPAPSGRPEMGEKPLSDVGVKWGPEHNRTAVNIAQQVFGTGYTALTEVQQRAVALAAHALSLDEVSPEHDAFLNAISEYDKELMGQIMNRLMGSETPPATQATPPATQASTTSSIPEPDMEAAQYIRSLASEGISTTRGILYRAEQDGYPIDLILKTLTHPTFNPGQ